MSMWGQETNLIAAWIEQRFADAGVVAALDGLGWTINGSLLSDRLFQDVAPDDTPYPFMIYTPQVDPEVIRGVGSAEVMLDTIYTVKAIAQGADDSVVGPVASVIHTAMVSSNGEAVSGGIGDIFMSRRVGVVRYTESSQGNQFRHLGGAYQLQARPS